MKKQLILKLIESNDIPTIGDIIYDGLNYTIIQDEFHRYKAETYKSSIIKPIAISNEEIKVGDNVLFGKGDIYENEIGIWEEGCTDIGVDMKIEVLPEQFSDEIKQAIVDGILKDGIEIEVEYDKVDNFLVLDSNNKAIITYNTFKVVSKEKLESRRSSAYEYFHLPTNWSRQQIENIIDSVEEELMDKVGGDYEYNGVSHYIELLKEKLLKQ